MSLGLRIEQRTRVIDPELVAKFRDLPVANVSDCMQRLTGGGANLRPLHRGGVLAGAAFTVRVRPGDNLMVHKALLMLAPGDVLVIDGGGALENALMGELMLSYARAKGAAGVVINGAVRDLGWIRDNDLPVFAAGISHRGPYKDGPGEINTPIALNGMVIEPGDLILGDEDGMIAVPQDQAAAIEQAARAKQAVEAKAYANTLAGNLDPKPWVDETLRRLGCSGL